ncbi:hypothetical protein [Janthinobacterium sp. BJB304]|uniref:hypothetical protein n=1 Tax=Janthinobacterium sp. BJB304 TaxID=1572871 RepID=UPI00117B918A|nr:hypothetical protein [Janthinobacterium sp. BJB304]
MQEIGTFANSAAFVEFPDMVEGRSGWGSNSVRFKVEAKPKRDDPFKEMKINNGLGVMNTQLGIGPGLKIFNDNILMIEKVGEGDSRK